VRLDLRLASQFLYCYGVVWVLGIERGASPCSGSAAVVGLASCLLLIVPLRRSKREVNRRRAAVVRQHAHLTQFHTLQSAARLSVGEDAGNKTAQALGNCLLALGCGCHPMKVFIGQIKVTAALGPRHATFSIRL
jgi:hypothetical protein